MPTETPFNDFCHAVVDDFSANRPRGFDPLTIIALFTAVVGAVQAVVQLWQTCNRTPAQALRAATSPGLFHRMMLNRQFRRHLPADLAEHQDELVAATIRVAATRTESDMAAVFAAVKN